MTRTSSLFLVFCLIGACALRAAASVSVAKEGPCGTPFYPSGKITTASVERPEGTRYFLVYVPSSYNPHRRTGLQFVFHGLNDNCNSFIENTGFIPYAEQMGYILVAPCGSIGLLGIAWNSGECCGFEDEKHPDDFGFARWMVQNISASMCIDPTRVVTTGFSNGAFMSEVLACRESDIFRGAASVAGVVELRPGNQGGLQQCTKSIMNSTVRPSILLIHGDLDLLVPWTGDFLLGFPPIPNATDDWVSRNRCNPQWKRTINEKYYTNQRWEQCMGWSGQTGTVELVRHHDGGHQWPIDTEFDTTKYIFNWMMNLWGNSTA